MTRVFNKTAERERRRLLRKNSPEAELVIWSRLKAKQLLGHKFRRQYSVGAYVIDFYCPGLKLAIEIDGDSHFQEDARDKDEYRQAFIEAFGIRFVRFTNQEVFENLEGVLARICQVMQECPPCSPPLPRGTPKAPVC